MDANFIQIDDSSPIAVKAHTTLDIWNHQRSYVFEKVILLTRNPRECVASQAARLLRKRLLLSNKVIERVVQQELSTYLSAVHFYGSTPKHQRLHLDFGRLMSTTERQDCLRRMVWFATEKDHPFSSDEVETLLSITKASQESFKSRHSDLRERIAGKIDSQISYDSILDHISHLNAEPPS